MAPVQMIQGSREIAEIAGGINDRFNFVLW
jgi:hypothetical protein